MSELLQQDAQPDFIQARIRDMEALLAELDFQMEVRLSESKRRLEEVSRRIDEFHIRMECIPSGDPGTVNSIRSQLFSTINSLEREFRNERVQVWKDVSALRIRRQELAIQISTHKRVL